MTVRRALDSEASALAPRWAGYPALVVEADGEPAGYAIYRELGDGETELLHVEIFEAFRRRGLAMALLAALPGERLFLEVRERNEAARALYEKDGWQRTGVRKKYYGDTGEDGIVMEKKKW